MPIFDRSPLCRRVLAIRLLSMTATLYKKIHLMNRWGRWAPRLIVGIFLGMFVALATFFPREGVKALLSAGIPEQTVSAIYFFSSDGQRLLGTRHFGGAGEYDLFMAKAYYARSLVLNPEEEFVHYQLARIAFIERRTSDALRFLDEEEKIQPDLARIYYVRGLVYGYDKQFDQAESALTEFVRREPREWAGYLDLGWIYFQQGKYREMKDIVDQALRFSGNAWLYNAEGLAKMNLGDNAGAVTAFQKAKEMADRMTGNEWGIAYTGNDPRVYERGVEEMRKSINENIGLARSRFASTTRIR